MISKEVGRLRFTESAENRLFLVVRIRMKALPEKLKEVEQTLLGLNRTMGQVEGCLGLDVFRELEDVHALCMLEKWATREDLDRHLRSKRFSAMLGTRSLLGKPMELSIHTVSRSERVDVVTSPGGDGASGDIPG